MRVSDLAEELDVPASLILDQCQRFGIDASWAGAELSGADLVVLRAELAAADAIDLTPADPPATDAVPAPGPESGDAGDTAEAPPAEDPAGAALPSAPSEAPLPPTAVGSMPELIDEVTPPDVPPPAPGSAEAGPGPSGPGFATAGAPRPGAATKAPPRQIQVKRRLERSARTCVVAIVVAAIAFAGANFVDLPAVVALLWLIAAIALVVAVVDGLRGRRRIQTHPERVHGLWVATIGVVVAIAGLIGLTASVTGAVGDDPAADAPLGVGDLQSVQVARWGYQRVQRIQDNGWKQPAREEGSCWESDTSEERDEDRVEVPSNDDLTKCDRPHTLEVAKVFAYNRDADAPYPTDEQFLAAAADRCGGLAERATREDPDAQLKIEYPTEVGWGDGDHDVACVLLTSERDEPLITS